jgi:hypothetical protein
VRKGSSHLLSKKDDLGLFYKRWAKGGVESERPSQYFVVKGENWCKVTGREEAVSCFLREVVFYVRVGAGDRHILLKKLYIKRVF